MTTLVTGGTGFVGGYVVRRLVERGDRVVCYDLAPQVDYLKDLFGGELPGAVEVVRGDVTDSWQLSHTVQEYAVEKIAHLAAVLGAAAEQNMPAAIRVNAVGTLNVFEAAALLNVQRVAWSSSIAVYGPRSLQADGRITDESVPDPQSAYGSAKFLSERLSVLYAKRYGLESTGVRFSTVYGYGKHYTLSRGTGLTWLPELIDKPAVDSAGCVVPGAGGSFDFQYVEDAARGVVAALDARGTEGKTYLTHGDQRPVQAAFDYVRGLVPGAEMRLEAKPAQLVFGGDGVSGMEFLFGREPTAKERLYDVRMTERDIGYVPRFTMEAGVSETINMLRVRAGLDPVAAEPSGRGQAAESAPNR